ETQLHLEEQAEQRKQAQLQDSRIKVYDTFVKTELDELITFVRTQKKTDIGKWRLAVAALVMKGTEGVEQVIDAGISDSETLEDIKKAFDKSITEARKILDSRNAIEVQYKVEQIKKALEQYKMLLTIHTHPLVLDYIGTAPTPEVRRLLRAEVLQRMQKMRGLPNSEELENIVMDAIDHITS
ncbi:MAG TPA: hypothetical protein VK338_00230, partial [Candidatus Nitrosocosmicus sp.]|nr:hypothetical protein [Candidatus Nitrosocosmicus sp.]